MKYTDPIYKEYNEIIQIYKGYNHLYHKIAAGYHLSDSVFDILYALYWSERPCTPSEIVDLCCSSKQTIHSALKKMEKEELLNISVSQKNKKNRIVELTDKGRELAENTVLHSLEAEINAFARIPEEDRETIIRLMGKHLSFFKEEIKKNTDNNQGTEQK
ncbi:MAG: winged helix DNA-binding protein [Firmicutes bacterium]|nr:winged helix DNA-binding protein [Bacillota bacterium]